MWHSPERSAAEARNWTSREWVESKAMGGVRFQIARVSFLGRIELLKKLRELMAELECRAAGSRDRDKVEAAWLGMQSQRIYIEWGLTAIDGLQIDGEKATPESLLASGPEELCREIAAAVKDRSFLSDAERKN
jgi:hypothetical protein